MRARPSRPSPIAREATGRGCGSTASNTPRAGRACDLDEPGIALDAPGAGDSVGLARRPLSVGPARRPRRDGDEPAGHRSEPREAGPVDRPGALRVADRDGLGLPQATFPTAPDRRAGGAGPPDRPAL